MMQVTDVVLRVVSVLVGFVVGISVAGLLFIIITTFTDYLAIPGIISATFGIYVGYQLSKWIVRKESEPAKNKEENVRTSKQRAIFILVIGIGFVLPLISSLLQSKLQIDIVHIITSLMGIAATYMGAHQLYTLNKMSE